MREKNYRLSELAKNQLDVIKIDIEPEETPMYYKNSEELHNLMMHCENDAFITMELTFKLNAIPLTHQVTPVKHVKMTPLTSDSSLPSPEIYGRDL